MVYALDDNDEADENLLWVLELSLMRLVKLVYILIGFVRDLIDVVHRAARTSF